MESSSPVLRLAVLDYRKLVQHFSSAPKPQQRDVAASSRKSGGRCCGSESGALGRRSSELGGGIVVGDAAKLAFAEENRNGALVAELMTSLGLSGSRNADVERRCPQISGGIGDDLMRSELENEEGKDLLAAEEKDPLRPRGPGNGARERSFSELLDQIVVEHSLNSELAEEKERDSLLVEVIAALGPGGSGLLAVRGVPEVFALRKRLLPLAKKLALMDDATRRQVLKKYGLSTDVPLKRPDRPVSAFATKLQYTPHSYATGGSCIALPCSESSPSRLCDVFNSNYLSRESQNVVSEQSDMEELGITVLQLGASMVEVGLLIARLCDSIISGAQLEDIIWESGSVKARLIHYHASTEKELLFHSAKMGKGFTNKETSHKLSKLDENRDHRSTAESSSQTVQAGNRRTAAENVITISEDIWQEWHYDYGMLTVLTAPMFLSSPPFGSTHSAPECESYPSGHTGLRILSRGVCKMVSVPPDCLIVQVGEAAQIASGGKLAAVAHCVCRPPTGQIDISRETFVTFLQPAWERVLNPPLGVTRAEVLTLQRFQESRTTKEEKAEILEDFRVELVQPRPFCNSERGDSDGAFVAEEGSASANRASEQENEVSNVVPSLESRWKEGFTFAEFSRETTAQYYGAQGRQRTGHTSAG